MSDKISFPFVYMHAIAQQIMSETDNLISETESRHQQILNTKSELPSSMQGSFDSFLEPFHRNLQQVLALRESIGKTLATAADAAEASEISIDAGFHMQ